MELNLQELCSCEEGIASWNSYFQIYTCNKCGIRRSEAEMKVIKEYLDIKYKEN